MRVTGRTSLVLVLVLALIAAGCNGSDTDPDAGPDTTTEPEPDPDPEPDPSAYDEDLDVLWAATFGDATKGSYSRYSEQDETDWRSRYQYADMDTMLPGSGVGDCGTDVNQPIGLFNLRQVYLFDQFGNPVDVSRGFEIGVGNRPGEVFGREGDGELRYGEQTLPVHVFEQPPATREDFIREANLLLARAEANEVPGPQIALDYVLSPTMFHGHGSEDPTPAAANAESESLVIAADATTDAEGSTIWVIDFGLPADAEGNWPGNISGPESQPRPASDRLTSQYAHGLMVASVAAQAAPSASVEVVDVAYDIGGGNEAISVRSIDQGLLSTGILQDDMRGVLNFSIGSYRCLAVLGEDGSQLELSEDDRIDALFTVLEPYLQRVPVVAAVGNDDTSEVLYPAGIEGVIGIAAVDETVPNTEACLDSDAAIYSWSPESAAPEGCEVPADREAPFNNTGAVDDDRAGVDLVVDYPTFTQTNGGPVEYHYYGDDGNRYDGNPIALDTGRVRMSGTSLAAPLYAACLAGGGQDTVC